MAKFREVEPITDQPNETPPEVGEDLGALPDNEIEQVDTATPTQHGTFAHEVYEAAADEQFDDVEREVPVIVTKPDGTEAQGEIDTLINGRIIVDYKTHDMRDWTEAEARRYGNEHGRQVQEYVDSSETTDDAQGWIISTVPPTSEQVRNAYSEAASEHGVGVKFAESESPESVIDAVSEAVSESEPSVDTAELVVDDTEE